MGQEVCLGCGGSGTTRGTETRPTVGPGGPLYESVTVFLRCGTCGGSGSRWVPDPPAPMTYSTTSAPIAAPGRDVYAPRSRGKNASAPWFPALDAWFDRAFPMKKRRRISGLLGIVGAIAGYLYATATGAAVGGWVLGGAVAGFVSLVLAFFAVKLLLVVLALGSVVLVGYLILSALKG